MTPPEPGLFGRVVGAVTGKVVDVVPVEQIVEEVDFDAVLDRVDVNRLLDRVDINELLDRVDIDRLMSRVDIEELVQRAGITDVVARTTMGLAGRTLDVVRRELAGLDRIETGIVDRILRRRGPVPLGPPKLTGLPISVQPDTLRTPQPGNAAAQQPGGTATPRPGSAATPRPGTAPTPRPGSTAKSRPSTVPAPQPRNTAPSRPNAGKAARPGIAAASRSGAEPSPAPGTATLLRPNTVAPVGRTTVSGRYAGPVSRTAAAAIDVGVILGAYSLAFWLVGVLAKALFGFSVGDGNGVIASTILAVWAALYLAVTTAISGRTVGKGIIGLTVVSRLGYPVRPVAAVIRMLAFLLSTSLFGAGLILIAVRRDHRALHDLIARTAVVYDWGDRPAELPTPLTAYIRAHDAT